MTEKKGTFGSFELAFVDVLDKDFNRLTHMALTVAGTASSPPAIIDGSPVVEEPPPRY